MMPIETIREGNKITKVCVEDVYKMSNRVQEALVKAYNNSMDIINSIHKEYNGYEGELIVGTGIAQPCLKDAFDEEIGNNIAFMKAKLNANLKKLQIIKRIARELANAIITLGEEAENKIQPNIRRDLAGIRLHNPDYLKHLNEPKEIN